MGKVEIHYSDSDIFHIGDIALLVGEVPNESSSFAVGGRIERGGNNSEFVTVVPFLPHHCYIDNHAFNKEERERMIDWAKSGGIEKVIGFKSRRDLTSALKNGDNVSIYISPIQSSKVLEYGQIIIPAECVRGISLRS
jgi:hypothetical protein